MSKGGLDKRADERLASGNRSDDGKGSRMPVGAYLDDVTQALPFQDLACTCNLFTERASWESPAACLLANAVKTKVLVMLDPEILPNDPNLAQAFAFFQLDKGFTRGTALLGAPIGCPALVNEALAKVAITFSLRLHASIQTQLDDLQTKVSLFCSCLQATAQHLLATDAALCSMPAEHPVDPFHWSSPFLLHLNRATACFLAHIS